MHMHDATPGSMPRKESEYFKRKLTILINLGKLVLLSSLSNKTPFYSYIHDNITMNEPNEST